MVFSRLGEMGEVVKSQPPIKDLEENKFGQMFTVLLLTKVPKKDIENAVEGYKLMKRLPEIIQSLQGSVSEWNVENVS